MTVYICKGCRSCDSADKALQAAEKLAEAARDLMIRKSGKQREAVKWAVSVFEAAMAEYRKDKR